jgi:rhamnogalacturonyl hydrolase YesR
VKRLVPAIVLGCLGAAAASGADRQDVLAIMERVADWQLAHPAASAASSWIRAAGDLGILALDSVADTPRYREAMETEAEAAGWSPGPRLHHADDLCIGQTYLGLYRIKSEPKRIRPLLDRLDAILADPRDGSLDFDRVRNPDRLDRWSWCDALFMAPPVWVEAAAVTGRRSYLDFADRHWCATADFLYDSAEGLFYRDSTQFARREPNGRKVFWSRGNGWVIAGLARILQYAPQDDPIRARYVRSFRMLANRLADLQPEDGMWRASLLDPKDFPEPEESGTALFCYAFAWGVNHGILDPARFGRAAGRAWSGIVACVGPEGRLNHVQPVGSAPQPFAPGSTAAFGAGGFLLAGSEIIRLSPSGAAP